MDNKKERTVICHNRDGEEKEVLASELKFRPSVFGILIENNKILLSKKWDGYDFPGGGVEIYETMEQALKREFLEETGLKVKVGQIIHGETSMFLPPFHKEARNCPLVYFLCEKISGKLSTAGFDEYEKEYADMPEWISLSDINKIKFYNSVDSVKLIKKAIENKKYLDKIINA